MPLASEPRIASHRRVCDTSSLCLRTGFGQGFGLLAEKALWGSWERCRFWSRGVSVGGAMATGWLKGTVKAVPSGDSLLIMGSVKGGPPPEKTITLAGLIAPKLVRTSPSH